MTELQSYRHPSIRVSEIFLCLISINSPTRFACRGISDLFRFKKGPFRGELLDPNLDHYLQLHNPSQDCSVGSGLGNREVPGLNLISPLRLCLNNTDLNCILNYFNLHFLNLITILKKF